MKCDKNKLKLFLFIGILFIFFRTASSALAATLESWNSGRAYKPAPILFLHGFAQGKSADWNDAKESLKTYFSKYQPIGSFLEAMDFQDPNGSIDRYPSGKFNPQGNSDGWADKIKKKIDGLLGFTKYGSYANKLNVVCHSMGGLAARSYMKSYGDNALDKLILIGVPNLGSRWAELANSIAAAQKSGWINILTLTGISSLKRPDLQIILLSWKGVDVQGEAVKDMDNSLAGSGFLEDLNSYGQSRNVDYYGIIGIRGSLMNFYLTGDYYGGDCIVSKDSQLGTVYVSCKDWVQINASHAYEPKISSLNNPSPLLSLLDSTKPEFEIITPNSPVIVIQENSVSIKGLVYKEYLPADSKLIINVRRQEDNSHIASQESFLKPSDLWISDDPQSPVAEFDEQVFFPGPGIYQLFLQN